MHAKYIKTESRNATRTLLENNLKQRKLKEVNGKNSLNWLIPASLFVAAMLVILDQILKHGVVWDWEQVLHHENFALALVSVAIGMLLSKKIQSRNEKDKNAGEPKKETKTATPLNSKMISQP